MIVLYASTPEMEKFGLPQVLGAGQICARDWAEFERATRTALCGVVGLQRLDDSQLLERVGTLVRRHPEVSLVVVIGGDLRIARSLRHLVTEASPWGSEVEPVLSAAVQSSGQFEFLEALASIFETTAWMPALLRRGLACVCRTDPPLWSIKRLTRELSCERNRLPRQWRSVVKPAAPLRLHDFMSWVVVVRALSIQAEQQSWRATTGVLDVERRRLDTAARRLTGRSIAACHSRGYRQLTCEFTEHLAHTFLDPGGSFAQRTLRYRNPLPAASLESFPVAPRGSPSVGLTLDEVLRT
jgi:hypothetical protein